MRTDRWLVIAIASTWLIAGVVEPHLPDAGQPLNAVGVGQAVTTALLLFAWCKAHAAAHAIRPPIAAPTLVGVFAIAGLPYYFFRGYGWRKGAMLLFLAICIFIVFCTLYLAAFQVSSRLGT